MADIKRQTRKQAEKLLKAYLKKQSKKIKDGIIRESKN